MLPEMGVNMQHKCSKQPIASHACLLMVAWWLLPLWSWRICLCVVYIPSHIHRSVASSAADSLSTIEQSCCLGS
jgi:hypothetical protein